MVPFNIVAIVPHYLEEKEKTLFEQVSGFEPENTWVASRSSMPTYSPDAPEKHEDILSQAHKGVRPDSATPAQIRL
jgi:hypothetical protein